MTQDELDELVREHPILYHMAALGSWPSIRRHGLLSTSALLDLFEVHGETRDAIESRRRPGSVVVEHSRYGRAVVRDQKPMDDAGLRRCLEDGLTPREWYEHLNARVFFWLSRERLLRLLRAGAYRSVAHDVLELDTRTLVAAHPDGITLATMNTGCTKPFPHPRGRSTILPVAAFPYAARRRSHRREPVVELAVSPGVPDIADHVRRVVVMQGDRELEIVPIR